MKIKYYEFSVMMSDDCEGKHVSYHARGNYKTREAAERAEKIFLETTENRFPYERKWPSDLPWEERPIDTRIEEKVLEIED